MINKNFLCESCFKIPIFGLNYNKNYNEIFVECLCENLHFCKKKLKCFFKKNDFFNEKNVFFNEKFDFDDDKIGFCLSCNKKINENYTKNHKKHKIEFFDNFFFKKILQIFLIKM